MTEELIGLIGGSGLGSALGEHIVDSQLCDIETPFGKPSSPICLGTIGKKKIAFLNRHGNGHKLPPSQVPFAANIFALKKLGVHTIIATGAVGSLQEQIAPGDLVVVDQFIDKTFKRTNSFFDNFGAVHCEMAKPVCGRLSEIFYETASQIDLTVHPKGTYVCMEGPQFSTRAESLMHKAWGGDLIGMTAMPEAKLAREAQICYTLIALPSDYDCWRTHAAQTDKQTLLKEIIANLQTATNNCIRLIKAILQTDQNLTFENCHCRKSLEIAVWTDTKKISDKQKDSLSILFD